MANQDRIIPIGTNESCMIGIEIISQRKGSGEFGKIPVWDYTFTLKGFNEDHSDYIIHKLNKVKDIQENDIEKTLQKEITKAIKICSTISGFEQLIPKQIQFCDFQKACSSIQLFEADGRLNFKEGSNDLVHSISYLDSSYTDEIASAYKEYFDFYFDSSRNVVGIDLKISSIRIYENSQGSILVFHLATGQEFLDPETGEYPEKSPYSYDFPLQNINDGIFQEPILHHGKGFDYYLLKKV
ncbi:MAG: hypothetical protein P1U56_22055 [Saprospiraceae bacterium]|nr:hypothetical protein [Saprospiraceae bacterium]